MYGRLRAKWGMRYRSRTLSEAAEQRELVKRKANCETFSYRNPVRRRSPLRCCNDSPFCQPRPQEARNEYGWRHLLAKRRQLCPLPKNE
ncbi:hypothetical protein NPIL_534551 [Nephila pilipes]|uniref:Uncharacterized protein n=1 Tax=Nephila pilipes TaxID=299642 RepID=A0A8X6QWU4_NEPPI|nr:hypothetical protein NPIL_534551 [Nephila pilipes]